MNDILQAIDRVPYFQSLPPADRRRLGEASEIRRCADGACLFAEGEPAAGVFVVLVGRVKLVRVSPDGREQVLHEEGEGATLGEVPVFDGGGYLGSAIAVGDVSVCFLPRPAVLDVLERHPAIAAAVIAVLAARLRRFAALVEDLSLRAVNQRLAAYLVRESASSSMAAVRLPATRDQLAAHLGTVREQASRALSELKRQGIIDLNGRSARIIDEARLRLLAGARPGRRR